MKRVIILSSRDLTENSGHIPLGIMDGLKKYGLDAAFITMYKPNQFKRETLHHYYYNGFESSVRKKCFKVVNIVLRMFVKNEHMRRFYRDRLPCLLFKSPKRIGKIAGFIPDAVIVFFMPEFLNSMDLFSISRYFKCKVIVSTPDMYPFTGLCHFSEGCTRYRENCGRCPLIGSNHLHDITWFRLLFKKKVYTHAMLYALCWTEEFEKHLRSSDLFDEKRIIRIPNLGVNLPRMYRPSAQEKIDLRTRYGIDQEDIVLLICAANLGEKRKGVSDIIDAVDIVLRNEMIKKHLVLVTAGKGELSYIPDVKRVIEMGHMSSKDLSTAYWLSDIYVSASKADVGPGTLLYALLCGILTISYKTGFAPDLIEDGVDGYLLEINDVEGIAKRIMDYINLESAVKEEWSVMIADKASAITSSDWIQNLILTIENDSAN